MLKKYEGNITFVYNTNNSSTTFKTSNLREMIRLLQFLPESNYPGKVTITSSKNLFCGEYYVSINEANTAAIELTEVVEKIFLDISNLYGFINVDIDLCEDASDMKIIFYPNDRRRVDCVSANDIEDINLIRHPLTMYLFILYKEVIGEPIGRWR